MRITLAHNVSVSESAIMHPNFMRLHKTLKVTPAMAASVTSKLREMSDMVKLLEDWESVRKIV
jgi:hypothetical protein